MCVWNECAQDKRAMQNGLLRCEVLTIGRICLLLGCSEGAIWSWLIRAESELGGEMARVAD